MVKIRLKHRIISDIKNNVKYGTSLREQKLIIEHSMSKNSISISFNLIALAISMATLMVALKNDVGLLMTYTYVIFVFLYVMVNTMHQWKFAIPFSKYVQLKYKIINSLIEQEEILRQPHKIQVKRIHIVKHK